MYEQFNISPEEGKRAKWPHEIFLINLIFNHVLLFCTTAAVVGSFPYIPLLVPIISFSIIGYILIKAGSVNAGNESSFVKAHWQIAARRNRFFMLLLTVACTITGGGLWLSNMMGWGKIQTIALIGGIGLLPFMAALLVLVVLGNESVFMARNGRLPKKFEAKNSAARATEKNQPAQK